MVLTKDHHQFTWQNNLLVETSTGHDQENVAKYFLYEHAETLSSVTCHSSLLSLLMLCTTCFVKFFCSSLCFATSRPINLSLASHSLFPTMSNHNQWSQLLRFVVSFIHFTKLCNQQAQYAHKAPTHFIVLLTLLACHFMLCLASENYSCGNSIKQV